MATNLIKDPGRKLELAVSHPASPSSGDPVRVGQMVGVALADEGDDVVTSTNTLVDLGPAVYDLSVKAVDDSGNSAVAAGEAIYYVDADTPVLSKKQSGYFYGFALEGISSGQTDTINVLVLGQALGSGQANLLSGSVDTDELAAEAVTLAKMADLAQGSIISGQASNRPGALDLSSDGAFPIGDGTDVNGVTMSGDATLANDGTFTLGSLLKTGFIPLPLVAWRELSSNDIINSAGHGGILTKDTTPILEAINAGTDAQLRLNWAAANTDEISISVPLPPDLDDSADITVHFQGLMSSTNDTPTLTVEAFFGIGDTDAGGTTGALSD